MDDVTSQRAQQPVTMGFDGGHSPLYHDPHPQSKSPSPMGMCGNMYNPGRTSPYSSFGAHAGLEDAANAPSTANDDEGTAQNDLELEIILRGNLLQQQQQRIGILEASLSSMCNEIQKYREQLQDLENDKGGSQKQPKVQSRYWTAEEHHQFLVGLEKYGPRDVKSIAALVATRNATQVRTHAQKYFLRMARENGEEPPDVGELPKLTGRKRVINEALDTQKKTSPVAPATASDPGNSPDLAPKEPDQPASDFGGGFGAAMGYELGTEFDQSLDIGQIGGMPMGIEGDSPLRTSFDDEFGPGAPGGKQARLQDFERRSVSPTQLEAVGANDFDHLA
eukprot:TRINITY_DN2068_c0_g1_i8.p1 TRINITY_DN2068_c0_g1~~TRINITY_DN2068_c0_g1_i8.p1  ORF type:complete len:336 (-),score=35.30 TRINITY_DN2068_c0_g1_i8:432-1439(-)